MGIFCFQNASRTALIHPSQYVSYERPALSKAYLFPENPARLPGFHTCVGGGGDRQAPEWYAEKGVSFLTGTKVTAVDVAAKKLTTASGDTIGYEKLLVATGARVRRLCLPACLPAAPAGACAGSSSPFC